MKRSGYSVLLTVVLLLCSVSAVVATEIPLADTGQKLCYDIVGSEIHCPALAQSLYGQDAQYEGVQPTYQDNGDQTVTDQVTGLIWIESDEAVRLSWQDAASYCSGLIFAKQSDWRLPSKNELESIVDYSRTYPAISQEFNCQSSFYWSSTPHLPNPPYAWSVYCLDGADHWVHKTNLYSVRCVRSGTKRVPKQSDGLEWQKNSEETVYTWQNALSYCENLSLDGKYDWRLPNIRELKSLVDYSRYYPAVDPAISSLSAIYWSATSVGSETPSSAWAVFFGNGDDLWKEKNERYHARCVRGGFLKE